MEKGKMRGKSPEERLDWETLSGGYRYFIWVIVFLLGGVELFVGIMSEQVSAIAAMLVSAFFVIIVIWPLLWDVDDKMRLVRRIEKQKFFPIRTKQFLLSKCKVVGCYAGLFWLGSLALQLVAGPLFGFSNILLYQGILLVVGIISFIFYLVIGTFGARLRD